MRISAPSPSYTETRMGGMGMQDVSQGQGAQGHGVVLEDRRRLSLTGVEDVDCFNEQIVHVVLNINIGPGDYVITSYCGDCREGNTIHVLPVLSAEDLKMSYRDGSKFTAHLLDGNGNPYAGQNVTFNINGVFYNRITNSNGDTKLNINLQSGEYIITSTYNGANISNKITISP